jgi:hypothetical protein
MSQKYSLSQSSELQNQLLEEYADVENDEEMILHNQWLIERERLRILLLDEARADFAKKTQAEQEHELTQLSKTGYSMEDLVDQVVDRQEHEWRRSTKNISSSSSSGQQSQPEDTSSDESDNEETEIVLTKAKRNTSRRR